MCYQTWEFVLSHYIKQTQVNLFQVINVNCSLPPANMTMFPVFLNYCAIAVA